ncbi:MAG: hypothetical protein O3C29_13890, partial [Proteobacteria bacterium]|nr:hypothetical protein [Pseudomonadota bacterium]
MRRRKPHQLHSRVLSTIDVALCIHGYALGDPRGPAGFRHGSFNVGSHRSIPRTSDPDALRQVRYVEYIVRADEEPTRLAKLSPRIDEASILVEDLDSR